MGPSLGDWAVWSVVEQSAKEIGIEQFSLAPFGRKIVITIGEVCDGARIQIHDAQAVTFAAGREGPQISGFWI